MQDLNWIKESGKDPSAFAGLYNKYFRQIYLFVLKRIDDQDISDDITSQVFMKAMLNLHKYEFKGLPFSAWLYRIASNEVNYYFRKSGKMRCISIEDAGLNRLMDEISENDNSDSEENLLKAFQNLSQEEIQILELRFFENNSFKEVGYILNITENNAKVKTYRALDKLKKKMMNDK